VCGLPNSETIKIRKEKNLEVIYALAGSGSQKSHPYPTSFLYKNQRLRQNRNRWGVAKVLASMYKAHLIPSTKPKEKKKKPETQLLKRGCYRQSTISVQEVWKGENQTTKGRSMR
jgi:hypothetical protein